MDILGKGRVVGIIPGELLPQCKADQDAICMDLYESHAVDHVVGHAADHGHVVGHPILDRGVTAVGADVDTVAGKMSRRSRTGHQIKTM